MPLIRKDTGKPSQAAQPSDVRTALVSGTPDARWAAARALGREADGAGPLIAALAVEEDGRVRGAIFTSLTHIGSSAAVEGILPCLRSDDAAIRTGALDALNAMPQAVAPYMERLLSDADPDVRLLACEIARRLPQERATILLCGLLERESAANVCAAAVDVLAETSDAAALPALARCAARFQETAFLVFAIKVATTQIEGGRNGSAKSS